MTKYLELLDKNDPINVIHLAMNGIVIDDQFNYESLKDYIQYMRELVSDDVIVISQKSQKFMSNIIKSYDFFKRYNAQLKKQNAYASLSTTEVVELINLIKNQKVIDNSFSISDKQYTFLYGKDVESLNDFINSLKLPRIVPMDKNDEELADLYADISLDSYFNREYKINKIYKPMHAHKNAINKDNWQKIRAVHGTTNQSLLNTLANGYLRPSDLKKNNAVYKHSGNMFGDAIYSALTTQISKPIAYLDRNVPVKYIIVHDIYYKDIKYVKDSNKSLYYSGKNLVWAKSIGAYNRDELMALPSQIDIQYIIEVEKRN